MRSGAFVAEIDVKPDGWPCGTRAIVRRESAHPGAQMRIWDLDGFRFQVVLTDQSGDPVAVEAAHRAHAHVEEHVKTLKDVGLARMPFTKASANRVWTLCCVLAQNLLRWFQLCALDPADPLARATPKTLRYRLLHVAGRLVRHARTITVRVERTWPWADRFTTAWARISALT